MSKKKKILPELRFPEFADNETWADRKLSDVLFEHKEKSIGNEEVYSVSVHKGVVNQIEHLGRVFAASNTDNYKRVLPGDIIYTKSPTGDFPFGIIKQSKVSKPVIVSPLYGVFKPETTDLGVILDAYFEYPERTINYLSSIVQKGAKNTINIHNDTFLSKSLVLPLDKREQSKIASFLLSVDELITAHIERLELLKEHKKGLMQNLFPQEEEQFPKLRFKEFEKYGIWAKKPLEIVATFVNEKTEAENLSLDTYISTENLLADYGGVSKSLKLPTSGNFTKYRKGDVLISNIRPYLKKVWFADKNGACSNDVIVIRSNSLVTASFLFCLLGNDTFINYVMKDAEGVKMPRGDKDSIKEYPVSFPKEKTEQQKIAFCLSTLDEIITAQSEMIEQLKFHKKGLMQRLLPKTID